MTRGIFPNLSRPMLIGVARAPSRDELAALAKRTCSRPRRFAPAGWHARWDALGAHPQKTLSRQDLLAAYGQDEASFAAFVEQLAATDLIRASRSRKRPSPSDGIPYFLGADDSSESEAA